MKILKPEWDPTANVLLTYVNKLTYTLEGQKHARHIQFPFHFLSYKTGKP